MTCFVNTEAIEGHTPDHHCVSVAAKLPSLVLTEPIKEPITSHSDSTSRQTMQRRHVAKANVVIVPRRAIRITGPQPDGLSSDAAKNVDSLEGSSPNNLLMSNPAMLAPLTTIASSSCCQIPSSPPEIAHPRVIPTEIGRTSCEKYAGFPVKQRRRGTILLDSPPIARQGTGRTSHANESYAPSSALGSMTIIKSDDSSSNALHRERTRLGAAENQELSCLVEEQVSAMDASEESPSSLICNIPAGHNLSQRSFTNESALSSEEGIPRLEFSLDCDDDDDLVYNPSTPFLCAPPRNMRLELSAFGELWSLVAEWVTMKR